MAARKLHPVTDSGITWEEPPPMGHGGGGSHGSKWDSVAAEIKSRPGIWALVGTELSNGVATWFRRKGFEVTTRNNYKPTPTTQVSDVYLRWNK